MFKSYEARTNISVRFGYWALHVPEKNKASSLDDTTDFSKMIISGFYEGVRNVPVSEWF